MSPNHQSRVILALVISLGVLGFLAATESTGSKHDLDELLKVIDAVGDADNDVPIILSRDGVVSSLYGGDDKNSDVFEVERDGDILEVSSNRKRSRPEMSPLAHNGDTLLQLLAGLDNLNDRNRASDATTDGVSLDVEKWKDEQYLETLSKDYVSVFDGAKRAVHHHREPLAMGRRARRGGQIKATVDLLVVVDNSLYRKAMNRLGNNERAAIQDIKKYYSLVVTLVDHRYSEIDDPDVNIRVRLAGVYIAQERTASLWAEQDIRPLKDEMVLDPHVALEKFQEWVNEEFDKLPNFDHAMGFTGYRLVSVSGKHTSGMAYIGTICQVEEGYSASVVEEDGGLSSVGTAVHELGHSLGSKHDGDGDNVACPVSRNYIMAPGNSPDKEFFKNVYQFSPCSLREFKKLLGTDEVDCLSDSSADAKMSILPGQIVSQDQQCKDVFGQDSGKCDMGALQPADEVCMRLWCIKPGKPDSCVTRGQLTAVLGTPCGDGRVCKKGECVMLETALAAETNKLTASPSRLKAPSRSHALREASVPPTQHARCHEDANAEYCRRNVHERPDICQRPDLGAYCCFTCSFVG